MSEENEVIPEKKRKRRKRRKKDIRTIEKEKRQRAKRKIKEKEREKIRKKKEKAIIKEKVKAAIKLSKKRSKRMRAPKIVTENLPNASIDVLKVNSDIFVKNTKRVPGEIKPSMKLAQCDRQIKGKKYYKFTSLQDCYDHAHKLTPSNFLDYLIENKENVNFGISVNKVVIERVITDLCLKCQKENPKTFSDEELAKIDDTFSFTKKTKLRTDDGDTFRLYKDDKQIAARTKMEELRDILVKFLVKNKIAQFHFNEYIYGSRFYDMFAKNESFKQLAIDEKCDNFIGDLNPSDFSFKFKCYKNNCYQREEYSRTTYLPLKKMFFFALEIATKTFRVQNITKNRLEHSANKPFLHLFNLIPSKRAAAILQRHIIPKYMLSGIIYNADVQIAKILNEEFDQEYESYHHNNLISFFIHTSDGFFSSNTKNVRNPSNIVEASNDILSIISEDFDKRILSQEQKIKKSFASRILTGRYKKLYSEKETSERIMTIEQEKVATLQEIQAICLEILHKMQPKELINDILSMVSKNGKIKKKEFEIGKLNDIKFSSQALNLSVFSSFQQMEDRNEVYNENIANSKKDYQRAQQNNLAMKTAKKFNNDIDNAIKLFDKQKLFIIPKSNYVSMWVDKGVYELEYNEENDYYIATKEQIDGSEELKGIALDYFIQEKVMSNSYLSILKAKSKIEEIAEITSNEAKSTFLGIIKDNLMAQSQSEFTSINVIANTIKMDLALEEVGRTEKVSKEENEELLNDTYVEVIGDVETIYIADDKVRDKLKHIGNVPDGGGEDEEEMSDYAKSMMVAEENKD